MAESARTFWRGHLRLAPVSIPVRLVAAEKAESEIRFHQVDRNSKQRIRYLKVATGSLFPRKCASADGRWTGRCGRRAFWGFAKTCVR